MVAVLLALALAQEKEEDLNRHAAALMSSQVQIALSEVSLTTVIAFVEGFLEEKLPFYIDPLAVKNVEELLVSYSGGDKLDLVLRSMLAPHDLVHFVWRGAVVVTTEKGKREFEKADWGGLDKIRNPKLDSVYEFDWSPFDPAKALEVLSKSSGLSIRLEGTAKEEGRKDLLFPRKVTLRTALLCLSRATRLAFASDGKGGLIARPPQK